MEVGNRIREEREKLGLSQEDLAQRIFVSRQTVSNWETGKTYPDVQSLLLLSSLFEVSVDSLVKGDVEAMQEKIENYELDRFKVKASMGLALALLVVGAVMLAILSKQGQPPTSPFFVIAILMLVAGVCVSVVAERIQKRYDIDTIREVSAFLDGADPAEIERNRKMPKSARAALQALAGAAVAIVFMTVVYLIISVAMYL
ncbi:MAG: helix-turn-helix domain-containing protein [Coriobacteriia bacterium]|nr:helix-turn-helix domain-containing protein [Coriobacteriia bacterium]